MNATKVFAHRSALLTTPRSITLQLPVRALSNSAIRRNAQPIDIKSDSSYSDQPFSNLQPELNTNSRHHEDESISHEPQDQGHPPASQLFIGTVTRTGTMRQTVQVTRRHQVFDSFLQKHFTRPLRIRVHDPHPPTYLREGDIVEYSPYTQLEKDTKQAKDLARKGFQIKKLAEQDKSGKAVRKFQRNDAKKKELQGTKARGVQWVVRRVITPFGVPLDERMEQMAIDGNEMQQPSSSQGGQDSILKSMGGNTSRNSAKASMAG